MKSGSWSFSAAFYDEILTKSNRKTMLMIEKIKKPIMHSAEDKVLNIDKKDIEQYVSDVKEAVGTVITGLPGMSGPGGDYYDREGKKRFLHRVQERDRVPLAEEGHREEYKG